MAHVTFIHGIDNKPSQEVLLNTWLRALRWETAKDVGLDLESEGVTCSIVYWADVLYAQPLAESAYESLEAEGSFAPATPGESIGPDLLRTTDPKELEWVNRFAMRLAGGSEGEKPIPGSKGELNGEAVREIWAPWFVKRPAMELLIRDAHHYLFNSEFTPRPGQTYRVQDEIRYRTRKQLAQTGPDTGPHIVVSHSLGTVIAYDCLKRVADCPAVDALVTIGSPLGISEVEEKLEPEWTRLDGYPTSKLRGEWHNISDRLDVVAAVCPRLASDYRMGGTELVLDQPVENDGAWRHDVRKYLKQKELREILRKLLN